MRTGIVAAALLAVFLGAGSLHLQADDSSFTGDSGGTDVVVLLDVSQSVLPYFNDVTDYVVTDVVKDYLRFGDTFHLLSFGDTTQVEIAEKVTDAASVKSFLGRLYLLYPLARHSDFAGALSYLYQYLSDLPENRPKVIVIITDGVNNPPEGSSTYGMPPDKVKAEIEATAAKIRANGWPVHFIKLPLLPPGSKEIPGLSSSQASPSEVKGGKSYIADAAKAMNANVSVFSSADKKDLASMSLAIPKVEFPQSLGKRDYAFSFPLKIDNKSVSSLGLELDHVFLENSDILQKKAFLTLGPGKSGTMDVPVLLPGSLAQGPQRLDVTLYFSNGLRVNPQHGILSLTLQRNLLAALFRSGEKVALFIALVAIGLFLVFLFAMLLRKIPRRASEAPVIAAVRESAERSMSSKAAPAEPTAASMRGAAEAAAATQTASRKTVAEQTAAEGQQPAVPAAMAPAAAAFRAAESALNAESLLADSAAEREATHRAESATATGLLAEAARSAAGSSPQAALLGAKAQSQSPLPSAAELAAAKREDARREAELLAEAAKARAPTRAALGAAAPGIAVSAAATTPAVYAPRVVKSGIISVELRVEGQNPHIGTRNVHEIRSGASRSVGGSRSDFLIFLVPVPRRVAELYFDGEKLTLVPRRPEFFPNGSTPIEDCMDKDIPMMNRRGYPLLLRFLPFERPADRVNRLLHCIETPGLFSGDAEI